MGGVSLASRTWIDPETGVMTRLCSLCEEPKTDFPTRGDGKESGICHDCQKARKKRYGAEGRLTVDKTANRESSRRYNERHRERRLKSHRDYMARVKADPAKHARFLEARRIWYRLKAEQEGRPLESISAPRATMAKGADGRRVLPSKPLAAFIDAKVATAREFDKVLGIPAGDKDATGVSGMCRELGVNERRLRSWRDGKENVTLTKAEAVLLAAGASWAEVWAPDDYPELYAGLLAGVA
jgi:hypothetical protein